MHTTALPTMSAPGRASSTIAGALAVAIGLVSGTSSAEDSGGILLAKAKDQALKAGNSALSNLGKTLVQKALNAYSPGLSSLLGLGGEPRLAAKDIIHAIQADGAETRELMREFWDWAQQEQDAGITADYDAIVQLYGLWNNKDGVDRLTNVQELGDIRDNCVKVLSQMAYLTSANRRVDWLHRYATLMSLTVAIQSEHAEMAALASVFWIDRYSGESPEEWWQRLSAEERADVELNLRSASSAGVSTLLESGPGLNFQAYLTSLDEGHGVGGVEGQSDFVTARDDMFSELTYNNSGRGFWVYLVGRNCNDTASLSCVPYTIWKGNFSTLVGQRWYADFPGATVYGSLQEAYEAHKRFVLEGMVFGTYGPVRALSEAWWESWGLRPRPSLWLDGVLEGYLRQNSDLALLMDVQTWNGMSPSERNYTYGYALRAGLNAIDSMITAARDNPDYMERHRFANVSWPNWGSGFHRFRAGVHLNAMKAEKREQSNLNAHYAAVPVAKILAVVW